MRCSHLRDMGIFETGANESEITFRRERSAGDWLAIGRCKSSTKTRVLSSGDHVHTLAVSGRRIPITFLPFVQIC